MVFRANRDLDAVSWRDEINALLPERTQRTLHFVKLNHGQKLAAVKVLGDKPMRIISILAHKPSIPVGTYVNKNQLYFYLARHLVERISWLCRDMRPRTPEGDGRVRITFSRRGGMSYLDFRNYLRKLKADTSGDVSIHWPVIDIDSVNAKDHSQSASLQLADIAASAIATGVEQDKYGNSEARYAEHLRKIIYCHSSNYFSYGIKFLPSHNLIPQTEDFGRFVRLFE